MVLQYLVHPLLLLAEPRYRQYPVVIGANNGTGWQSQAVVAGYNNKMTTADRAKLIFVLYLSLVPLGFCSG